LVFSPETPLRDGMAAEEIQRAAMSSAASGGRIVEPATEEDF
jgi:hypothetical protein